MAITAQQAASQYGFSANNPYLQHVADSYNNPFGFQDRQTWSNQANIWEQQQKNAAADKAAEDAKKPPPVPEVDPRFKKIQETQSQIAKDFRSKIPQMGDKAYGLAERDERKGLASTIADQKVDFNRRGLLYSGTRLGAEANARGNSANKLATKRSEINQGLMGQADALDQQAIDTGFSMAGLQSQGAQAQTALDGSVIDLALQKQKQQQDTLAGLGKAAGAAAGGYLGSKSPTSINPNAWSTQFSDNATPKTFA